MDPLVSTAIQIAIVMLPSIAFILLKRKVTAVRSRLSLGVVLALLAGSVTFYLASNHGWSPMAKSGKVVELAPVTLFAINSVSLMLIFTILTFAKRANDPKA
jgi:hypothetical protein